MIELKCVVVKVEMDWDRPKDAHGFTDYTAERIPFTESTFNILQNDHKVRGNFTVRQSIPIGTVLEIKFDIPIPSKAQETGDLFDDTIDRRNI